jgi:ABC-type transport system involved in multi-copper enzyme maturation permease subunit
MVGLIVVGSVGLVAAMSVAIISKLVDLEVAFGNIFLAGFSTLLLVISFGAVGFMASSLGRGGRTVTIAVATFYAFGGYILASLVDVAQWLEYPSKIFPFNYYQPGAILAGTYKWTNMLFIVGVIVVAAIVSWLAFRRRDLISN